MGSSKLSHTLIDLGFFWVLGTTEHCGGLPREVRRRTAYQWDYNNGVAVVYDEEGRPWVLPGEKFTEKIQDRLEMGLRLTRGAYVPHSNDGGGFVRRVILGERPQANMM